MAALARRLALRRVAPLPLAVRPARTCGARLASSSSGGPADEEERPAQQILQKLKAVISEQDDASLGKRIAQEWMKHEVEVRKSRRRVTKTARVHNVVHDVPVPDDAPARMRCVAHSIQFDFDSLVGFLRRSEHTVRTLPGVTDAVHVALPSARSAGEHDEHALPAPVDAFLFASGALVLWNLRVQEEELFLNVVRTFTPRRAEGASARGWAPLGRLLGSRKSAEAARDPTLPSEESEQMDWLYTHDDGQSGVRDDAIWIARPAFADSEGWRERAAESDALDRLAFSYALVQCVKLARVESHAETTLDAMRGFSHKLAETGNANFITLTQVNGHIGKVMQLREFNLDADIVETPDFFWEDSARDALYQQLHRELEIGQRIGALNRKLMYAHESLQNVNSVVVNKHSTRLESRILLFVAFEACLDAAHLLGFLPEGVFKPFLAQLVELVNTYVAQQ